MSICVSVVCLIDLFSVSYIIGGVVEYSYKANSTSDEVTVCPVSDTTNMVDSVVPTDGVLFLNNMYTISSHESVTVESDPKPNPKFRRSLTAMVLVDESDMTFEDSVLLRNLITDHEEALTAREKNKITINPIMEHEGAAAADSHVSKASRAFNKSLEIAAFRKSMKMALDSAKAKIESARRESPMKDIFGVHGEEREGEMDRVERRELWELFLMSVPSADDGKATTKKAAGASGALPTIPGKKKTEKNEKKPGKK